jgi:hypothetical protein
MEKSIVLVHINGEVYEVESIDDEYYSDKEDDTSSDKNGI